MRVPFAAAMLLLLPAQLSSALQLARFYPMRTPAGRAAACTMGTRNADELGKLQATLSGLKDDGFPPETLAPLEAQIAELEAKVATEEALPPLTPEQRRIWDMCDDIDKEAGRTDEDAPKRLSILRRERAYLLDGLLQTSSDAYLQLLPLLSQRGLSDADYPSFDGVAMKSAVAVEARLQRILDSLKEQAAAQAAAPADVQAAGTGVAASGAADEAAMAAAEAEREAAAAMSDGLVDVAFAKAFLISEEARLNIPHAVVGENMWSENQEKIRIKTVRTCITQLLDGKPILDALCAMAREDKLASRLRDEARASSVAAAAAAPSRTMPVDVPSTVADRLEAAWKNSAQFVAEWQSRAPVPAEDAAPVDTDGLSAVGRLRKTGASSDPMSAKADSASQSVFGWSNLNDKFNDFIDDMNQKKNK